MATLNNNLKKLEELSISNNIEDIQAFLDEIILDYSSKEKWITLQDILQHVITKNLSIHILTGIIAKLKPFESNVDRTNALEILKTKLNINPSFNLNTII